MKKTILNYKGAILFYILIILAIFILNARFTYLEEKTSYNNNNIIAVEN